MRFNRVCFIHSPWPTLNTMTPRKTSVYRQISAMSCVKKKNTKKVEMLSNSSVHLEAIQRCHTGLRGESERNYVGRSECSRQSVQPYVSFLKTCSASWRPALLLWGGNMRHLLDGVREIQSSFHYAKKLLIKTSFSLLTIVLQGIGLLWPLILKRCLIEIDCVCVFYSPPPPPLPALRWRLLFWSMDFWNWVV